MYEVSSLYKQATVHLTQILNGQMHKMDLCESCAQAKGVTNPENLSIGSLMENASEAQKILPHL